MELDAGEQRRGMIWFVGAGLFGLALTIFLAKVDLSLTNSDYAEKNYKKVREVRIASSTIPMPASDARVAP